MSLSEILLWITPWEPLPWLIGVFALTAACYGRGLARRRRARDILPAIAFFVGLASMYIVMQTYVDYYAQYMFFIHRGQHLILHHLGPFLIALSMPTAVLAAGAPRWLAGGLRWVAELPPIALAYRIVQHPVISAVLFVGLIYFWLWPAVHFTAMLSARDYWVMNLSMAVDGLLFWWFMLDPRRPGTTATTYSVGLRIIVLWAVMPPQIALGAYIALADHTVYDVYAVCGRAFPISPIVDQQLGGLITWIPAAMMSVVATLVLLRFGFRHEREPEHRAGPDRRKPAVVASESLSI
ncbi:cytochrome c oxidase assembly protein [Salinisphaera sp. T31B1]|uniref:cytochrome c oxidase assembly protein n=1 Tax=Salinisphaera sp. T31B1 TaxID=727963 RepID=UPI00333FD467